MRAASPRRKRLPCARTYVPPSRALSHKSSLGLGGATYEFKEDQFEA